jgi:hypothetical protein
MSLLLIYYIRFIKNMKYLLVLIVILASIIGVESIIFQTLGGRPVKNSHLF